ncbi:hypothetical protein JCM24511_02208 [Saitozyma sp. JCM 24511]|nr:hypothetical protein JCM24511_02208 [Saitozyma sp. JCM 24511]
MPLYKITSKRLARKEREDASGLTELKAKILEELGEDDGSSGSSGSGSDEDEDEEEEDESGGSEGSEGTVDSEESSDEDEDEDEEDDAGAETTLPAGSKRKRPHGDSDSEEDDGSVSGDEDEDEDEEEEEEDEDDDEEDSADVPFTLTLDSALTSPIYPAPRSAGAGPDGRLCVLCPGKVLKHERMVEVHLSSSSHTRALKRFQSRLSTRTTDPLGTVDPREVVAAIVAQLEGMRAGQGRRADRWQKPRESKRSERRAVMREKKAARRALKAGREAARKADAEAAASAASGGVGEHEAVLSKGKKGKAAKADGHGADGVGKTPADAGADTGAMARAAKRLKKEAIRLDAASHGHRRAPRTIRKEARAARLLAEAVERGDVGAGVGFDGTTAGGGGGSAGDVSGRGRGPPVGDGEQLEGWNRMARRMAQKQGIHVGHGRGHSGSGWGSKANSTPLGVGQSKGQGQAHGPAAGTGTGPGTKRAKKEHKREVKAKREERKVERRRKVKAEKEGAAAATATATA